MIKILISVFYFAIFSGGVYGTWSDYPFNENLSPFSQSYQTPPRSLDPPISFLSDKKIDSVFFSHPMPHLFSPQLDENPFLSIYLTNQDTVYLLDSNYSYGRHFYDAQIAYKTRLKSVAYNPSMGDLDYFFQLFGVSSESLVLQFNSNVSFFSQAICRAKWAYVLYLFRPLIYSKMGCDSFDYIISDTFNPDNLGPKIGCFWPLWQALYLIRADCHVQKNQLTMGTMLTFKSFFRDSGRRENFKIMLELIERNAFSAPLDLRGIDFSEAALFQLYRWLNFTVGNHITHDQLNKFYGSVLDDTMKKRFNVFLTNPTLS